ncbi:AMP-binding protein, partial [Acinetobacter baumannii]
DLNRPDQVTTWSHRDIDTLASAVASHLTGRGLPRGTSVAILSLNRAEYIATYFGIMRAGFVAVPVNTKLPQDTIDYIFEDSRI